MSTLHTRIFALLTLALCAAVSLAATPTSPELEGRCNILSQAVVTDVKGTRGIQNINDDEIADRSYEQLEGLPAVVEFEFGESATVSTFRLFNGQPQIAHCPSTTARSS